MKSFLVALKFLTIVPLGKELDIQDKKLAKSAGYFPLVGALIGALLVAIDFMFRPFFPGLIVNLFVLISLIFITGGLHLDGLMDSADGLFSGQNKERILEIMRDSKVGSFGILAVICLLLTKLSFLNELEPPLRYPALILMPVLGRWAAIFAAWKYPYARKTRGTGKSLAGSVGLKELILASVFTAGLVIFLTQFKGMIVWFAVFLVLLLLTRWINKKIRGMTGDTYGAVIEIIELVTLIFLWLTHLTSLSSI